MSISAGRICILLFFSYLSTLTFGQEARSYKFFKTTPGQTIEVMVDAVDLPEIVKSGRYGTVNRYRLSSESHFRLRYTPFAGAIGLDTVILKAYRDDNFTLKTPFYAGFIFQVNSILTKNDYYSLTNKTPITLRATDNDISQQGDILIRDILFTKNGKSTISGDRKSIIFTPGDDGFSYVHYIACNGSDCDKAEVVIRVDAQNYVSRDTQFFTIFKNESIRFLIPPSLSPPLPYYLIGTVQQINPQFYKYSPRVAFTGKETVRFTNNNGNSPDHVVIINIIDPFKNNGWNNDDRVYTEVNHPVSFNVFANDNLSSISEILTQGLEGQIIYSGSGNFQYSPHPDFNGRSKFSYVTCGEGRCDTAVVHLGVHNFQPKEEVYFFSIPANRTFSIKYNIPIDDWRFVIKNGPSSGRLALKSGSKQIDYTPNGNFFGLDETTVEYCVTNSNGQRCYPLLLRFLVGAQIPASTSDCEGPCVWPGDGNADGVVNAKDVLPLGLQLGISGPARTDAYPGWYGRNADSWSHRLGIGTDDLKHLDFNGDGILNTSDTQTINSFYSLHHSFVPEKIPVDTDMRLFAELATDNLNIGDWAHIEVFAGTQLAPLKRVSGIHFSVKIEENYVDSTSLQWEQYSESWFGSEGVFTYAKLPIDGVYDVALVKIDNLVASGHGLLGDIKFIVEEDIDGFRSNKRKEYFNVKLEDIELYFQDGETLELADVKLRVNLNNRNLQESGDWVIYPSPAQDEIHLNTIGLGTTFHNVQISDAFGRHIYSDSFDGRNHLSIPLYGVSPGLYVITILTNEGDQLSKKIQVLN